MGTNDIYFRTTTFIMNNTYYSLFMDVLLKITRVFTALQKELSICKFAFKQVKVSMLPLGEMKLEIYHLFYGDGLKLFQSHEKKN